MECGIYIISNTINGKNYVGSAKSFRKRWNIHKSQLMNNKHHSNKLQNAWNKYGCENFVFVPIQYCETEYLITNEQWWINHLDSFKKGYNATPNAGKGSLLGVKFSDEHKKNLSIAKTGLKHTQETKDKLRKIFAGKRTSPATEFKKGQKSWNAGTAKTTKEDIKIYQKEYRLKNKEKNKINLI